MEVEAEKNRFSSVGHNILTYEESVMAKGKVWPSGKEI